MGCDVGSGQRGQGGGGFLDVKMMIVDGGSDCLMIL